jgi:hypothetical protein
MKEFGNIDIIIKEKNICSSECELGENFSRGCGGGDSVRLKSDSGAGAIR